MNRRGLFQLVGGIVAGKAIAGYLPVNLAVQRVATRVLPSHDNTVTVTNAATGEVTAYTFFLNGEELPVLESSEVIFR